MADQVITRLGLSGIDPIEVVEPPERIQEMKLDGHDDEYLLLTDVHGAQVYVWPSAIIVMQQVV